MGDYYRKPIPAVCPDGRVRKVRVRHYWDGRRDCLAADTFFSVPAAITYRGKYLHGYVTGIDWHPPLAESPSLEFRPHTVCPWPSKES